MVDRLGPDQVQDVLVKTRIAPDLLAALRKADERSPRGKAAPRSKTVRKTTARRVSVIIELNDNFPAGPQAARDIIIEGFGAWSGADVSAFIEPPARRVADVAAKQFEAAIQKCFRRGDTLSIRNSILTRNYLFGRLAKQTVTALAALESKGLPALIYKIWLDHTVQRCVFASSVTIKCDAARAAFAAAGCGIVWAVADTGIDGDHPHFKKRHTLDLPDGLLHRDFTSDHRTLEESSKAALEDTDGHGSHVAGIIAGETDLTAGQISIHREVRSGDTTSEIKEPRANAICGVAPLCKLMSLKVLSSRDDGQLSLLLAAIGYIQLRNDYGRKIMIHGLNMSLGYGFDPTWFASGQSPLCAEVDRLVRSGVVVVVAAGNAGYGPVSTFSGTSEYAAHTGTINDPGNAALAITVGSTHRTSPHAFGVSFFSGKGPTADGRMKPDLVAPGERIISCALHNAAKTAGTIPYREDSGTSMAAPHVSGAAAAFLSVRNEFIGEPEKVKAILVRSATDLERRQEYQGAGLIDVFRALQSV